MKENTLIVLFVLLLGASPNEAFAQSATIDIVTMKDGRVLKGKIVQYAPGDLLLLEKEDGQRVEIFDAEVSKIQQGVEQDATSGNEGPAIKRNELPTAETRGLYANSMLSFAIGSNEEEGMSLGAGFGQVVGYQFSDLLGLGVGVGIDNYSRRGETVYPLFGEARLMFPSQKKTGNFYGVAGGGYSLAFPRKSLDIEEAKGGPVGYLAIGYQAATTEGVDIFVDLGAKFQQAQFLRTLFNGDVENREIDFRRVVIRVGIGLRK